MAPNCQPSKIDKLKSTRKDQRGWPSEVHWYFMAQIAISCSQLPRHRLGACDGRFISSIHSRTPAWCTGKHQLHELFLRSNSFNDFASSDPHHGISSHIFLNIFWHFTQLSIWHLFWHSICNSFWQSIWYLLYLQILRSDVTCLLHPVESISNIFGLKCSCQATLARKLPDTCHIFWHSVCHMYLAYLLTILLAFYLLYLWRFFVAEVRLGTLWSCACCPGPAGKTAIYRLQLRSGGGGGRRCGEGEGEGCGTADIRSNNPHLIGGEKNSVTMMQKMMTLYDTKK